jgi:hypothetical protein
LHNQILPSQTKSFALALLLRFHATLCIADISATEESMALVKFGGGIAGYSGKIAGTVFARNRSGAYARNWAVPVNPGTTAQSIARSRFGQQSFQWSLLTQANRTDWNGLASTMTRLNRLGESYVPTGRQIFLESSNNLALVGEPILTDAPISNVTPSLETQPTTQLQAKTVAGELDALTMDDLAAQSGIVIAIEAAPSNSGTKKNLNNQMRFIGFVISTATIDLKQAYVDAFGLAMQVGETIQVRLKAIDTVSGFGSAKYLFTTIASL